MQLSKRLQCVADLVTPGNRVADVGCDHAYTSIYLAKQGISPRIIAMDVNQGPVDRAKENINRYHCEDRIEVRKSDGLEKLEAGEADSVIIAGMGGALMVQILTDRIGIMKTLKELVLQPQSEINKVRQMLCANNFVIVDENMMKEDGKYYVMMKAVPFEVVEDVAPYELTREEHYYYGKLLLKSQNAILREFLMWDLGLCEAIHNTLAKEQSENVLVRRKEIEERMELIQCGLAYFAEI